MSVMTDWQTVREKIMAWQGAPRGFDLRPYWRARAYREHAGLPEPVIRARAFQHVLHCMPLHFYDGERLCGSRQGWWVSKLPRAIDEDEYRTRLDEHDARGQRDFTAGWDHSLADYPTLLAVGIGGLLERTRESLARHSGVDEKAEQAFLRSVQIALEAFSELILRHASAARAAENIELAALLDPIVLGPPQTFHQAIQLVWLAHLALGSEGRYHMALGRIDQYLQPFYERDLREGRLTREEALDLICHLWVRQDESPEVMNICIGGLTPDGRDATNELSYLCLEATRLVHSPYTNLSARFHDGAPPEFHEACFDVIRTGIGFPAIFNDHVLIEGLTEIGIPPAVARDYCMVGCIETMLAGRQPAWSDSRFNMPLFLVKALEDFRGRPGVTLRRVLARFRRRLSRALTEHVAWLNDYIAQFPPSRFPDPFLSALTRDCIARAKDINDGGAEFERFHGICIMGLATTADSLAALQRLVFEERRVPFEELLRALEQDFAGAEPLRQLLLAGAPKYGNDEPGVDAIAAALVDFTSRECLKHRLPGGGRYVSAMAANISNIPAGKEVGATPDGRHAFTPLSDAASPAFGRDEAGPTAFLNSVATPDYHRVLTGSVINMKFDPEHFNGPQGRRCFTGITQAFVKLRIPELQFNFTGNTILRAAQREPAEYRSLVVRVSGFSAFYTQLDPEVQDDIIRRRAHLEPV